MNQSLGYLKEVLSNYTDRSGTGKEILKLIMEQSFSSEESFVRELTDSQIDFLNKILPHEINHAKNAADDERAYQLNEVFELLF